MHDFLTLRPLRPSDAEPLGRFLTHLFGWTYGSVLPADVLARYGAAAFAAPSLRRDLAEGETRHWGIVRADGEVQGYGKTAVTRPLPAVNGERPLEIARFYLDPAVHGQGWSSRLLAQIEQHAAAGNHDALWLCVWSQNPRAIAFYQKSGFARVGTHTIWVEDVGFEDWVMVKEVLKF